MDPLHYDEPWQHSHQRKPMTKIRTVQLNVSINVPGHVDDGAVILAVAAAIRSLGPIYSQRLQVRLDESADDVTNLED